VRFAESLRARARGEEVPEGGYQGEYVADVAKGIPGAAEMELDELGRRGVAVMVERAREALLGFGVEFDVWFSEASLHPEGVERGFRHLDELGQTYRQDGALWVKTSEHGDDKNRVIAVLGGLHPERAVLTIGLAELVEVPEATLHALRMQRRLAEPHVELDAEAQQRLARALDHHRDAAAAELVELHLGRAGDALRHVGDVLALVAALGDL